MKDIKTPMIKGKALEILTWVGVAIAAIIVVTVLKKVISAANQGATLAGNIVGDQILSGQTGIPAKRLPELRNIAQRCYDAITRVPLLNMKLWFNDKAGFVQALNTCVTGAEVKYVSIAFKELSGETFRETLGDLVYSDETLSRLTDLVKTNMV